MPLPVYHLRRLLAATAVVLTVVVAGMYFYARMRTRNVLNEVPSKIGYDIKQTASGFQFSKSDGKRTLFTVQASHVKEFKLNGLAELQNVSIVLYGRDSSRYDRIYGDSFAYDPKTGNVTAKGGVQIDLLANPAGLLSPDQSAPADLKNSIHLKTRDLVFNRDSGNAWTDARVEFQTPQASGWAVGVKYAGKTNTLTLASQIHVALSGDEAAIIDAEHGSVTNDPRQIVLDHLHLEREGGSLGSDRAVLYLDQDNAVKQAMAVGNVEVQAKTNDQTRSQAANTSEIHVYAQKADFALQAHNLLRTATLTGDVHIEQSGPRPMQGQAGRLVLDFAGHNQLQTVHALDGAHLAEANVQGASSSTANSATQDFELTAPGIDFVVAEGHRLERAVTSGAARIILTPAERVSANAVKPAARAEQTTVVTAGRFEAKFTMADGQNHLSSIYGAPDARIVNSASGRQERVSTSESVEALFLPQGGIAAITQRGDVAYTDGLPSDRRMQAWASNAHYTPADQVLVLTGNPRVASGSMVTTARDIRINRVTGDALAAGDVKSTYTELKEQPDGALLASASPIHVTSHTMTARDNPGIALYTGNVRLWQDANVIEAPSIQFDRERRFVTAQGTPSQPVKTILVPPENTANAVSKKPANEATLDTSSPITITGNRLTYADPERKVHYEGNVVAKGADFTASAKTLDAYLRSRSQTQASGSQASAGPSQLDRMVAEGDVLVRQNARRAEGQKLVYTAAEEKFVLTGGPPSIFDAERGKITGVSLTFFRRDDRVLVEGEASTPVVTQTRVAQ
ncbi:MAG TPA: LptA/OstA family protein [Verrucomicrobiae bacterium]|nr:LptA/OstA family protein [Verrucomicrobiae bacterium]